MNMQPKRIHKLSIELANQIAAGEVIERPASVLKELLENSLDAGSTQITVRIERGGLGLIQVEDNGCGICQEDLTLSICQHATSKVHTLSDLEEVRSYGFRGEALASIFSVSRLTLASGVSLEEPGCELRFADNRQTRDENSLSLPILSPIAPLKGTTVTVRDLFYNTPARRKFLKSDNTERLHLEEVFKRVALSQPSVGFQLWQNFRSVKKLFACRTFEMEKRRVGLLCGQGFIQAAHYIEAEANGLKLRGWLGTEKALRAQSDLQYFYVNGRMVRDKIVNHAVREAYQIICPKDRFPAYILFLDLEPQSVDVNVHPTKHEVRFRESRTVHAFLVYSIREGLKPGMQKRFEYKPDEVEKLSEWDKGAALERMTGPAILRDHFATSLTTPLSASLGSSFSESASLASVATLSPVSRAPVPNISSAFPRALQDSSRSLESENVNASLLKPLSVLEGEVLLAEQSGKWLIIDIVTARNQMMCLKLKEEYAEAGKFKQKPLLLPKTVSLGKNIAMFNTTAFDWRCAGFEFTQIGLESILVRSLPAILSGLSLLENTEDFERINYFNDFINGLLLDCQHIDAVIIRLAREYARHPFTVEDASHFLKDLEHYRKRNLDITSFCRELTSQQIRAELF